MVKFNIKTSDPHFSQLLQLQKEFSFSLDKRGIEVEFIKCDKFDVILSDHHLIIYFRVTSDIFKGLGIFLSHPDGKVSIASTSISELTYMADASRNAVMTVETVKKLIRYLAVMGYTSLMMYTEDTYEVSGEPYFGYFRGRYSKNEIKEIDAYACDFGIELIPCIQTLAHVRALTRHTTFKEVFDVNDILLVDEDKTYELIEKMIKSCAESFSSRKINIGMDEAYFIGRGRYQDLHGATKKFDIMMNHLKRVNEILIKYHFAPMMWSDMFFALTFNSYYETNNNLPPEILAAIPANIRLIYWDYYRTDYKTYHDMIKKHLAFNNDISYAGGAWKWLGFTPDNRYSIASLSASIKASIDNNIDHVIVTGWGDNGGVCSSFATLPSLYYAASAARGVKEIDKEGFVNLFGIEFDKFMGLDKNNQIYDDDGENKRNSANHILLFNDPLLGTYDSNVLLDFDKIYDKHCQTLTLDTEFAGEFKYLFMTQAALSKVLMKKATLGKRLRIAYQQGDNDTLQLLVNTINCLILDVEHLYLALKTQWDKENKPHGFDVQDIRFGGLLQRLKVTKEKIDNYLTGVIPEIAELEEVLLDYYCRDEGQQPFDEDCDTHYQRFASVNFND